MKARKSFNKSDVDLMEEFVYNTNNTKSDIFSFSSYCSFNSALLNSENFPGSGSSFMINSSSVEKNRNKSYDKSKKYFL